MIRVVLPPHLRTLAGVGREIQVSVDGTVTQRSIVDAIEAAHPMLRGTIRDHQTRARRPMVRFFVSERDLSHEPLDAPLPDEVARGKEPFWILGAIAGGQVDPCGREVRGTPRIHSDRAPRRSEG